MQGVVKKRYCRWLGGIQVMMMNSSFYDSFISMTMLAMTMWYTAGYPIANKYAPWFTLPMFFGLGVIYKIGVMLLDRKVMFPQRLGYIAEKTYENYNPTIADIQLIKADIQKIKEALNIDN